MTSCPLCAESCLRDVYRIDRIPCLQNRLFNSSFEAKNVLFGELILAECQDCGFVFNRKFESEKVEYDSNYSNDQTSSSTYMALLKNVSKIIMSSCKQNGNIIEIGCGNGSLLELLMEENVSCLGFDPAYNGDKKYIVKDYFGENLLKEKADVVILRHVLEHLGGPRSLLNSIKTSNGDAGKFYLEVPTLDWIIEKNAFCDIFYEHCNYFTKATLSGLFNQSIQGELYDGQYIYLIANSKDLNIRQTSLVEKRIDLDSLKKRILIWEKFVKSHPNSVIWGAGAKGVNFLNLIDPEQKYCIGAIDINQGKQGKYVPGTGHMVFGPDILQKFSISSIIVMNPIYENEIRDKMSNSNIKIVSL